VTALDEGWGANNGGRPGQHGGSLPLERSTIVSPMMNELRPFERDHVQRADGSKRAVDHGNGTDIVSAAEGENGSVPGKAWDAVGAPVVRNSSAYARDDDLEVAWDAVRALDEEAAVLARHDRASSRLKAPS
jgi:hypothetical protein